MTQKKKWSAQSKLKIALMALKGDRTIHAICHEYQVAPSQVHAWKKQLLEEGEQLFEKSGQLKSAQKKTSAAKERETAKLYEKIGQLTVERDFLKKIWGKLHGKNDEP